VTQRGDAIIDIGIFGSKYSSNWEIETQRDSSFRGRNPMEASTSGPVEIRLIIIVVATIV